MKLYYIIFSLFLFNVSINNSAIDESLEECDLYVIGACFFDDGIYEEYFDDIDILEEYELAQLPQRKPTTN